MSFSYIIQIRNRIINFTSWNISSLYSIYQNFFDELTHDTSTGSKIVDISKLHQLILQKHLKYIKLFQKTKHISNICYLNKR
jgi:hypothetical protein